MDQPKTFPTKLGFCHVFPDRLILSKDGDFVTAEQNPKKDVRSPYIYLYSVLCVYVLCKAVVYYTEENYFNAVTRTILGIAMVFIVIKSFNNTAVSVIKKKQY